MPLTAESALPLQKETTDKKKRMPLNKYFKGHGEEVMNSIRNAHPGASDQKVKSEFYATANARKMTADDNKSKSKPPKRKSVGQMIAEG